MPPTPHGFLGRRRACHGGLGWAGLGASEGPKSTPEGAKRAPRRAPGASWAPGRPQVATKAALRPPLGGSWGALGALLGSSWDLLGRSRPLLGRSWGSLWPPGGAFFAVFACFFGGLARGLEKTMVSLFLWCFLCAVLVLFLSLSCLPRGAPGRRANIEQFIKNNVFYNEFAGVPFLRQVQREQISEHRRTQNCKKNTCRNSPRDV